MITLSLRAQMMEDSRPTPGADLGVEAGPDISAEAEPRTAAQRALRDMGSTLAPHLQASRSPGRRTGLVEHAAAD